MFNIPVTDTQDQTRAVLAAIAAGAGGQALVAEVDPAPWHELQLWLEGGAREAIVPFASVLAAEIPPVAVRLRRDFGALLGLIQTHAILHQAQRDVDKEGRVVATIDDYAAVYDLIVDLMAAGVDASVPATTRETVAAVAALTTQQHPRTGATLRQVAEHLKLDKSSASRRVNAAIKEGFLINGEERKGRSACLEVGEPLPNERATRPSRLLKKACGFCASCPPGMGEGGGDARRRRALR
jgi:hypothetical protein